MHYTVIPMGTSKVNSSPVIVPVLLQLYIVYFAINAASYTLRPFILLSPICFNFLYQQSFVWTLILALFTCNE